MFDKIFQNSFRVNKTPLTLDIEELVGRMRWREGWREGWRETDSDVNIFLKAVAAI